MTPLKIVLDPEGVDEILDAEELATGFCPIEYFLVQYPGTPGGNAAAMLVVVLPDGSKVLAKTTLRLLELAVQGARARAGPHVEGGSGAVH